MQMEELMPCPICHEDCAFIETEGNWCVYVQCGHCGTHAAFHSFDSDESKKRAEENVVHLWNMGKVIAEARTEGRIIQHTARRSLRKKGAPFFMFVSMISDSAFGEYSSDICPPQLAYRDICEKDHTAQRGNDRDRIKVHCSIGRPGSNKGIGIV